MCSETPDFPFTPGLFISCQGCTQANGTDKITFRCPSRPRNPGPLERIILDLLVRRTQDFDLPTVHVAGDPSCYTPPFLPDVCFLPRDPSGTSWSCLNSAFSTPPLSGPLTLLFHISLWLSQEASRSPGLTHSLCFPLEKSARDTSASQTSALAWKKLCI